MFDRFCKDRIKSVLKEVLHTPVILVSCLVYGGLKTDCFKGAFLIIIALRSYQARLIISQLIFDPEFVNLI